VIDDCQSGHSFSDWSNVALSIRDGSNAPFPH
jgi:hypothetical protein